MNKYPLASLLLAQSVLCGVLVLLRNIYQGELTVGMNEAVQLVSLRGSTFLFIGWNLFLAWVPYCLAVLLPYTKGSILKAGILLLWLLFFPNAPYLITDLIHLRPHPSIPLWYDAILLFCAAWTGLLLGYASLFRVEAAVRQWGYSIYTRLFSVIALLLCGFGVYLGRFLRWNSWDAIVHPLALVNSIVGLASHYSTLLHSIGVTALLFTLLGLGYFTFIGIAKLC